MATLELIGKFFISIFTILGVFFSLTQLACWVFSEKAPKKQKPIKFRYKAVHRRVNCKEILSEHHMMNSDGICRHCDDEAKL